jgi:hypothetical protein
MLEGRATALSGENTRRGASARASSSAARRSTWSARSGEGRGGDADRLDLNRAGEGDLGHSGASLG